MVKNKQRIHGEIMVYVVEQQPNCVLLYSSTPANLRKMNIPRKRTFRERENAEKYKERLEKG